MSKRATTWAAIALLILLVLAFYRQILLTNLILSGVDALTYFYPYRDALAQALHGGRIPLWNPYLFMGVPFLANPQAAVFYPPNLALSWLPAPKAVAWSIALHATLAAASAFLYARYGMRLSLLPALLAASAYAFGGYLSGQVEHVNQFNVSAWFPLLLLLWELRPRTHRARGSRVPTLSRPGQDGATQAQAGQWCALLGIGALIGVGLLAGHTQATYISAIGLGLYALLPALVDGWRTLRTGSAPRREKCKAALHPLGIIALQLAFAGLIGIGLAAVQLIPTLELSRLSIRSGGMSYREAVSFSLKPLPRLLRYTFLPPWGRNLADVYGGSFFTEYLAYIGFLPLLLAAAAAITWLLDVLRIRQFTLYEGKLRCITLLLCVLAALGVFLALGLYNPLYYLLYLLVPGFSLFRVPARWLFLYAFATAMLAGIGLQGIEIWLQLHLSRGDRPSPHLWREWACRAVVATLVAIALFELYSAARMLPLSHPTAPEAYSSLRTAPAHLLAAQSMQVAPGRFLSMSDIAFDPGDLDEIQHRLRDQLSEEAIYDYVVSVKRQEILAPNLPLTWRIYAVDGYDGGVLPLARYVDLQRLLLDESEILTDGRLREGLREIPPSRLLSILGVRYLIADKVHDVWIDDVFYDLAFDAALEEPPTGTHPSSVRGEVVPPFDATAVGVVSYLEGAQQVPDGTPIAEIRLTAADGDTLTLPLLAGSDTAEGLYDDAVAHSQARVGHPWRDRSEGNDYVTRLDWDMPRRIAEVEVVALPSGGVFHLRGLSLIDARDGSNVPVVLSTGGQFRRVHSGDVKIYAVLDALPRATIVRQTQVIPDDEAALTAMLDPSFDPAVEAILADGRELQGLSPQEGNEVVIAAYRPERVTIRASLAAPGYLVLSDTWYPGWQATVDGQPAEIERANLGFRAVYLPAGTHTVQFVYAPLSFYAGLGIALLTLAGVVAGTFACWKIRGGHICTQS